MKDSIINCLKMKLSDLLSEESKKTIKKLESIKADLNATSTRADKVLDGLGLIWVGENAGKDSMACCTSTNENYVSLKRIPPLRKRIAREHQNDNQINTAKEPVVPFSGVGYRLGTGSEVFGYKSDEVISSLETKPAIVEDTIEKSSPLFGERHCRAKTVKKTRTIPVESASVGFSAHKTDDGSSRSITDQPKFRCEKSLEELPVELLHMTTNQRRRALKQTSFQVQKNMDKYSYWKETF
uniref:Uncharacterized protein n=1 Tax=Lygus hesperus TaxID=30085 RepID=A0A0A9X2Z2_LYGHE